MNASHFYDFFKRSKIEKKIFKNLNKKKLSKIGEKVIFSFKTNISRYFKRKIEL